MDIRRLGALRLEVSALGFGCVSMSGIYGPVTEADATVTIIRACELGVSFFDTADSYGGGANEELLGRALSGRRAEVAIATKGGLVSAGPPDVVCGRPEYIKRCCDDSLRRLGTDWIDLYYLHRVDPAVPIEETIGSMARLVEVGKVRHLGICEASPRTLQRAAATHPITALQSEWSLWTRDIERDVLVVARELGIGVVPYSPLGRGFLTGQVADANTLPAGDYRRRSPRFTPQNYVRNRVFLAKVQQLATNLHCTTGQLALAWLLAQGEDVVPIPGTRKVTHLEENVGALDVKLSRAELALLDAAARPDVVAGARYADPTYHYGDSPELAATDSPIADT